MQNLHRSLRRDAHLKYYGRLQYTLFLKGIGLGLEECLLFWRQSFHKITDDTFNKEYRYNVRHAYGDVGGDTNRRGGGCSPFSCQKILTEHPPGPGENHGCPYRHFNTENLTALLQAVGVTDRGVLQGVKEDKEKQKFHMACNRYGLNEFALFFFVSSFAFLIILFFLFSFRHKRVAFSVLVANHVSPISALSVFEYAHSSEIRRAKEDGAMTAAQLETIVHPNEYFKRSYLLKNLGHPGRADPKTEGY